MVSKDLGIRDLVLRAPLSKLPTLHFAKACRLFFVGNADIEKCRFAVCHGLRPFVEFELSGHKLNKNLAARERLLVTLIKGDELNLMLFEKA